MTAIYISYLVQPCKNRGVKLENPGDGTVKMNGFKFETIESCERYLESKPRLDLK